MSANNSLYCAPVSANATSQQQKDEFLKPYASGEKIGCFALSEPGNGSDAGAASTTAKDQGDHFVLNGTKAWITNALEADAAVVFATTDKSLKHKGISAFVVDRNTPGFSVGAPEDKLGIRGSSTANLIFEDCKVPKSALLGKEGDGFKIAMKGLDGGRINIATCSIGTAQAALNRSKAYLQEREQFGEALANFQALQFKLADMATELVAARQMIRLAAFKVDALDPEATAYAAMAKRFATDAGFHICNEALQLHGGYGYMREYPLERYIRDNRVHQILEGTNEIMRVIVARRLLALADLEAIT